MIIQLYMYLFIVKFFSCLVFTDPVIEPGSPGSLYSKQCVKPSRVGGSQQWTVLKNLAKWRHLSSEEDHRELELVCFTLKMEGQLKISAWSPLGRSPWRELYFWVWRTCQACELMEAPRCCPRPLSVSLTDLNFRSSLPQKDVLQSPGCCSSLLS